MQSAGKYSIFGSVWTFNKINKLIFFTSGWWSSSLVAWLWREWVCSRPHSHFPQYVGGIPLTSWARLWQDSFFQILRRCLGMLARKDTHRRTKESRQEFWFCFGWMSPLKLKQLWGSVQTRNLEGIFFRGKHCHSLLFWNNMEELFLYHRTHTA